MHRSGEEMPATGRRALLGGLRMLAIGAGAGALTYVLGSWLGVALA